MDLFKYLVIGIVLVLGTLLYDLISTHIKMIHDLKEQETKARRHRAFQQWLKIVEEE